MQADKVVEVEAAPVRKTWVMFFECGVRFCLPSSAGARGGSYLGGGESDFLLFRLPRV